MENILLQRDSLKFFLKPVPHYTKLKIGIKYFYIELKIKVNKYRV